MTLTYHAGQIEVQHEANTRRVAGVLADWVGPVREFTSVADLILLATPDLDGALRFSALSGRAPLVETEGASTLRLPDVLALTVEPVAVGGIAISLAQLRRARINGSLALDEDGLYLEAREAFTNCRKYISPSIALEAGRHCGPVAVEECATDAPGCKRSSPGPRPLSWPALLPTASPMFRTGAGRRGS